MTPLGKRAKSILATFCAGLLGLLAGEVMTRLLSKHWVLNFDVEMWRYARTVKRQSDTPGVIHDHAPNAEEKLMGVMVRTDERGFRRSDPATETSRSPRPRLVVALGDSVVFGWGVPESGTLASHLERRLEGARVINAGVGNSNTAMELARYKRDLRGLKPDWVILGFFVNDAEPNPVAVGGTLLRHSAMGALFYGVAQVRGGTSYRSYQDFYRSLYADGQPGWDLCRRSLAELGLLLRQDGVKATLLLIPEMHEPKNFGPFADIYRRVGEEGQAAGFEVIDASTAFPAGSGAQYFVTPLDAHPNSEAQAMFASALARSRFFANPR